MKSYDVRVWNLGTNTAGSPEVRWRVGSKRFSRSFQRKALADSFRSKLLTAQRDGEAFDQGQKGLPESMLKAKDDGPTWIAHTVEYVAMKWGRLAPNSRRSIADSLARITPVLTMRAVRGRPDARVLRRALYEWAYGPPGRQHQPPAAAQEALDWLHNASIPVTRLGDDLSLVRAVLDAISRTLDGEPAAATTIRRTRATFNNALRYAVERRLLHTNPLQLVQWTAPEVADMVDRRVVANPSQVRALLNAVAAQGERGRHLRAYFACLYYAAMRPGEAIDLRKECCVLPAEGWGRLDLGGSAPRAGGRWTNSGKSRERRELKRRARNAVRPVPIPPEHVGELRAHLDEFGTAPDGRLFQAARGGELQENEYLEVWATAREKALTAAQVASPLAGRPYDLRHAGVSLWLNSGVDPTEVARRAGHSVDVLLRVYAGVLDNTEQRANQRIEAALRDHDTNAKE